MDITTARMEVLDRLGNYVSSEDAVTLTTEDGSSIDLTITKSDAGGKRAEIRRSVTDPKRAAALGNGDDDVLLDWFQVNDADVYFYAGELRLRGYMSGVKGHRRDGVSPYGDGGGNAYLDDDQTLVHVRWLLS